MLRAIAVGDHLGEFDFIECGVVETDRAGVHRRGRLRGHHRHHCAGIDAARQEGAQRHVGDHAQADRLLHPLDQFVHGVRLVLHRHRRERHVPILLRQRTGDAALERERETGRQLVRTLENGARLRHVTVGKIFLDRQRIDVPRQAGVHHQRLQFRTENEFAGIEEGVIQRLDAETVAHHEQRFLVAIPQRKREHAAEACHAGFAPGFPCMDDDFGVGMGAEGMAQRLQFGHQFLEVVDFAVEHHDDRAVLVEQRLLAGGQVDDGQAPVPQPQPGLQMQAAFVGAAMELGFVHAMQQLA